VPLPAAVFEFAQHGIIDDMNLVYLHDLVNIDNDNLPIPENIPQESTTANDTVYDKWGHSGVCERKALQLKAPHAALSIKHFSHDVLPTNLQLFEPLSPWTLSIPKTYWLVVSYFNNQLFKLEGIWAIKKVDPF